MGIFVPATTHIRPRKAHLIKHIHLPASCTMACRLLLLLYVATDEIPKLNLYYINLQLHNKENKYGGKRLKRHWIILNSALRLARYCPDGWMDDK